MKTMAEFLVAVLAFPVGPLGACYAAAWLSEQVENSLPPCVEGRAEP